MYPDLFSTCVFDHDQINLFLILTSVSNKSDSESALFRAKKRQKAPQIFFSKSATILVKGATIWDISYWAWSWKWPTKSFLLHFYVTISPRAMQNCETTQILIFFYPNDGKLVFFYAPQKNFRATRKSQSATLAQKRHY